MAPAVPAVSASSRTTPAIPPLHDSRRCLYVMGESLCRRDARCQLRVQWRSRQETCMTCPDCGREMERLAVRLDSRWILALWIVGLFLAGWLGGDLLHDVIEGMEKSLLPMWKLWLPVGVLVAAIIATSLRLRRPVCPGCGARSPAGFVATAEGSTHRAVLRAGCAAVAATVGGAAVVVGRNAGWPSGARSSTPRSRTPPPRRVPSGRAPRSARTVGSGGRTRWYPTSRSPPAASATRRCPWRRRRPAPPTSTRPAARAAPAPIRPLARP